MHTLPSGLSLIVVLGPWVKNGYIFLMETLLKYGCLHGIGLELWNLGQDTLYLQPNYDPAPWVPSLHSISKKN